LPRIWEDRRRHCDAHPDITGEELFTHVVGRIAEAGWKHGATHAGRLVGEVPARRSMA